MEIPAIVKMVVVTKKVIGHVDPIHRTAGTYRDVGTVTSTNVLGLFCTQYVVLHVLELFQQC